MPGFDQLSLQQKQFAYYLYEAALCGRDIVYDQRDKYNLLIRKTLEHIYSTYKGDKETADWEKFRIYAGRFWFSNGNHHHYGNEKFVPESSFEYLSALAENSDVGGFPFQEKEKLATFLQRLKPIVFDPDFQPKLVDLSPEKDNVDASSNNFYEGVTQKEVEAF